MIAPSTRTKMTAAIQNTGLKRLSACRATGPSGLRVSCGAFDAHAAAANVKVVRPIQRAWRDGRALRPLKSPPARHGFSKALEPRPAPGMITTPPRFGPTCAARARALVLAGRKG